jgi:hypothetical protein
MAKGFSFSPEQDRLYALGWPHVRVLVDKHKLDKKPDETARGVLEEPEPTSLFGVEWPRETAHRFVRAVPESVKSAEYEAALAKPGPVTPEEARKLIDRALSPTLTRPQLQVADFLLLLEAITSTEVVADAILSRFERYQSKDWLSDNLRNAFFTAMLAPVALPAAYHLGFFFLRVAETARKKYRARTDALLKKAQPGRPLHVAFDLVLHGGEAVRRHRVKALCACHHVTDDPNLVRMLSSTDEHVFSLSPRFVFLGGGDCLDHYAERAKALPRWTVLRFAEEFGTIKHPKMVPIMLTLSGKKTAKDAPLRWFEAHAEFARPLLEEAAVRKSPQGEAARALIEQLDAPKPVVPAKKTAAQSTSAKKEPPKPAPAGKAKPQQKSTPVAAAKRGNAKPPEKKAPPKAAAKRANKPGGKKKR